MLLLSTVLFFGGSASLIVGISEAIRTPGWRRAAWAACAVGAIGLLVLSLVALEHAPGLLPDE